jgi:hypothetical protein
MAQEIQRMYGLPVVALRLGEEYGWPGVDVSLVDNRDGTQHVLGRQFFTLDAFGFNHGWDDVSVPLAVPGALTAWVAQWADSMLPRTGSAATVWLHLVKPYGYLGAVPWERDLQPALSRPLLRIPDAFPTQDRASRFFDVAIIATTPAPEGPSSALDLAPAVAQALAEGVGERLRLHVFADLEARAMLRQRLEGLKVRSSTVYDLDAEHAAEPPGEVRNGWLRWVRRAMTGSNLDAVHFVVHGNALDQDGAILTTLEPDSPTRPWPVSVQSGELRTFLNQVGALVAGFSRPRGNYSDFGLRRLVDDLSAVRSGPVLLHDPELDPGSTALADCYRFLTWPTPSEPPSSPGLTLMAQPRQVYPAGSSSLTTSRGDDLPLAGASVVEHFAREETPMWLAAAERYLEHQQGELLSFRQAASERQPTPSEQAYYSGVESAIRQVRGIIDRHAEAAL